MIFFYILAEVDGDFSQVPQYSVLEEGQMMAPASQILLVCCWRTMKEVALLLGELAENAPIQVCNSKDGLLTPKQVMKLLHEEYYVWPNCKWVK